MFSNRAFFLAIAALIIISDTVTANSCAGWLGELAVGATVLRSADEPSTSGELIEMIRKGQVASRGLDLRLSRMAYGEVPLEASVSAVILDGEALSQAELSQASQVFKERKNILVLAAFRSSDTTNAEKLMANVDGAILMGANSAEHAQEFLTLFANHSGLSAKLKAVMVSTHNDAKKAQDILKLKGAGLDLFIVDGPNLLENISRTRYEETTPTRTYQRLLETMEGEARRLAVTLGTSSAHDPLIGRGYRFFMGTR